MRIILLAILLIAIPAYSGDLTTATIQELVAQRPDLVEAIQAREHQGHTTISVEKNEKGRRAKWIEFQYDINGSLTGKRVEAYTYYPTGGEVDVITQQRYEGDKLVENRQVKHFTDGKQPIITNIAIPIKETPKL